MSDATADEEASATTRVALDNWVVYASLGALGYIFTKLMSGLEDYDEPGEIREMVEMGMRIPAAWVLGAGFYRRNRPSASWSADSR